MRRPWVWALGLLAAGIPSLAGAIALPEIAVTDSVLPADDLTVPFGSVPVGTSVQEQVFVFNLGAAPLLYGPITVEGQGFSFEQDLNTCSSLVVDVEQRCRIFVTFDPPGAGNYPGSLIIGSNDPDESVVTVALSGTGTATAVPDVSVTPVSVDFGSVPVGSSAQEEVTISNAGTAALEAFVGAVSAPFAILSNTCDDNSLVPQESCVVTLRFDPAAAGPFEQDLVIDTNDPDESQVIVALSGTGIGFPDISIDPVSVDFGTVTVGSRVERDIAISNAATATADLEVVAGPLSAPFQIIFNGCEGSSGLGASRVCFVTVRFTPLAEGTFQQDLVIDTNDPDEDPVTVPLSGIGVLGPVPDLGAPESVSFGEVAVGDFGGQTVTLSNLGTAELQILSISATGDAFRALSGTCFFVPAAREASRTAANGVLAVLLPGQSCTVDVAFEPTAVGEFTGALEIGSNDPDAALASVPLSGEGFQPLELSGSGVSDEDGGYLLDVGSVVVAGAGTATVALTNRREENMEIRSVSESEGGFQAPFSLDASGCEGALLGPGESCTLTVTFEPTEVGEFQGFFFVEADDPESGTRTVEVRVLGRGIDVITLAEAEILGGKTCFAGALGADHRFAWVGGVLLLAGAALAALLGLGRSKGIAILALGAVLVPGAARAFDGHLFQPRPGEAEFVSVRSSATPGHLGGQAGLFLDYANSPVRLDTGPGKRDLSEHQFAGTLVGGIGLGTSFHVGLRVPYLLAQSGEEKNWVSSAASNDLGDIEITGRYRVMGTGREGYGLAVEVSAVLPTGSSDQWFGNNAFAVGGHLVLDRTWPKGRVAVNAGYVVTDDEDLSPTQEADDLIAFGLAGTCRPWNALVLAVEVYGNTNTSDDFDDRLTPVELDGWLGYDVGPAQIVAGGGGGLTAGASAPEWRAFGGVRFDF